MTTNKKIDNIISTLGIKTTAYWIGLLKALPQHEVGVIKVAGKILLENSIDQFSSEISFLAKEAGFHLPIVIGSAGIYDQFISSRVKGDPVIIDSKIVEVKKIAQAIQQKLVESLKSNGTDAVAISPETIFVTPYKAGNSGYYSEVLNIDTKPIIAAIREGKIPILCSLGVHEGKTYCLGSTSFATELIKFLQAKKLIIVGQGPIFDKDCKLIKSVSSDLEFEKLEREGIIRDKMLINCKEAYELLEYLGPGHSVQITTLSREEDGSISSTGLLEELIGNGSGTILRIPPVITSYPLESISKERLKRLINASFTQQHKILVDNYFDMIKPLNSTVYLDSLKRGGAITYPILGFEYLCKLFTHFNYEGLGIASSIIDTIILQKKSLAWRTSITNTIAINFYNKTIEEHKGESVVLDHFVVYLINIPADKKDEIVEKINSMPVTMKKKEQEKS